MCYTLYLSTNSSEDLTSHNSELVTFEKYQEEENEPVTKLLDNPNKWYVASKAGCSCTFRHLTTNELGFGEPVYWYKEEYDAINATLDLYGVIHSLVSADQTVDLIDKWEGASPESIKSMEVALKEVPPKSFRLYENYKFIINK